MNVNLYIDFYFDSNPHRAAELQYCLEYNASNPLIDNIIIYASLEDEQRLRTLMYELKIAKVLASFNRHRPTYNDFFIATEHISSLNDINIISNADIYFIPETIMQIKDFNWANHCMALTRWDEIAVETRFNHPFTNPYPQISLYDHADSQDAWVFQGRVKRVDGAYFTIGVPGCDNRIAHLLSKSGFNVINPSHTIKIIHKHKSSVRNYTRKQTIPPPYLTLRPTNL